MFEIRNWRDTKAARKAASDLNLPLRDGFGAGRAAVGRDCLSIATEVANELERGEQRVQGKQRDVTFNDRRHRSQIISGRA